MNIVTLASFDIGKKNFSWCVEEFDQTELLELENIPVSKRYNLDGSPTLEMQKLLDQVCMNGRIVSHENIDLTEGCDPKKKLDPLTFHNMIEVLDRFAEFWDQCSAFVIEEQMSFKGKYNTMAVKLAQHCASYFMFRYGQSKPVIEFPSYHKTQVLGAEKTAGKVCKNGKTKFKTMDKPQRKKWSVNKCIEILTHRGEIEILDELTSVTKKDDLADCCLQLQAAKYLIYVNKSLGS
jgi:hypothetical protein